MLIAFELKAADFLPASFEATYEESFVSSATGKTTKTTGKISYQYPRKVRFEILTPNPSTFVSNGEKSWRYTPPFIEGEEGQVEVQKASDLPATQFLDLLKRGINQNPAFKVSYSKNVMTFSFVENWKKNLGIEKVILVTDARDAKSIKSLSDATGLEMHYVNNRTMNWVFKSFKVPVKFKATDFEFQVPKNTKVVESK
jgi:outer membrane lipoprotein-sorting protein